jgi:hypothetical protein
LTNKISEGKDSQAILGFAKVHMPTERRFCDTTVGTLLNDRSGHEGKRTG